jgi:archaeal cell division control protein 6
VILKKNIFCDSSITNSLFKDENIFDISYFPENVFSRDKQIKEIKYLLEPLTHNKKTQNIIISGPPGTGKTLVTNYVLSHLVEYSSKVKYKYLNAISDNSKHSILYKIATMFDIFLPRRGLAVDEILDKIKEGLSKSSFLPVVVIDEIDQLTKDGCSSLLYDLSRVVENNKSFCLILITNNIDFFLNLDQRTQSSLFLNNITFPKYTPLELKAILSDRVKYGFIDNVISEDLLGYVCGFAAKRGGDARVGIDFLYKSVKLCEQKGLLKITKEILLEASKLIDTIKFKQRKNVLSEEQLSILKNIEDGMLTSKLYEKKFASDRTVRRHLLVFEKLNLIRLETFVKGRGRSRKIFLNFNKDLFD